MKHLTRSLFVAGWVLLANCSVEFGEMSTITTPTSSSEYITSLQNDLRNSDRLLITTTNRVHSVSKADGSATLIAGKSGFIPYLEGDGDSAYFSKISALVQLTDSYYLVTDSNNYCMREIRATEDNGWITAAYAGGCAVDVFGKDRDGYRLDARFNYPIDVVRVGGQLFIIDGDVAGNVKIKTLDLATYQVITIFQSEYTMQYLVAVSRSEFYVTSDHGVLHIKDGKESWLVGGDKTGVYDSPKGISRLTDDTLLVANSNRHTLQLIYLNSTSALRICTGSDSYFDGDITLCGLSNPWSLYVTENKIYIGEKGNLRVLSRGETLTTETSTSSASSNQIAALLDAPIMTLLFCHFCYSLKFW